jgi:hypothetical protein
VGQGEARQRERRRRRANEGCGGAASWRSTHFHPRTAGQLPTTSPRTARRASTRSETWSLVERIRSPRVAVSMHGESAIARSDGTRVCCYTASCLDNRHRVSRRPPVVRIQYAVKIGRDIRTRVNVVVLGLLMPHSEPERSLSPGTLRTDSPTRRLVRTRCAHRLWLDSRTGHTLAMQHISAK